MGQSVAQGSGSEPPRERGTGPHDADPFGGWFVYFLRLAFLRAFRLVTRVAALLDEDEELPCFFGEIFFSAIPLTPLRETRPNFMGEVSVCSVRRSVPWVTRIGVTFVTREPVTDVTCR